MGDIARELLSALANCASDKTVRENYQAGKPDTEEVIYIAMMSSAAEDPDIIAQGCRALHALSSTFNVDTGEFSDNPRAGWEKIMFACTKVAKKFASAQGKPLTKQNQDGVEVPSDFVTSEAEKLRT